MGPGRLVEGNVCLYLQGWEEKLYHCEIHRYKTMKRIVDCWKVALKSTLFTCPSMHRQGRSTELAIHNIVQKIVKQACIQGGGGIEGFPLERSSVY